MMEFRGGEGGYAPPVTNTCAFQSRIHAFVPGVFRDPKVSVGRAAAGSGMLLRSFQPVKSVMLTDSAVPTTMLQHGGESLKLERSSVWRAEPTCESGWTTYLDQSDAAAASVRGGGDGEDVGALSEENCREDPSMASDASSGPEQPGCRSRQRKRNVDCWERSKVKAMPRSDKVEDDLDDTCQSNLSCESVSDDPRCDRRQWSKRRKVDASVTLNHSVSACSEIGDGHSDENDVEVESEEAEICSRPSVNDAVHTRLEVLQELIPNTQKLDGEQVLEVAIDYVKSLETKIKMFEAAQNNNNIKAKLQSHESLSQTYPILSSNALQDKGLCLFPVSMVAS